MTFTRRYATEEVSVDSVTALPGMVALEFGTAWCGYCIAGQPAIEAVLSTQPQVAHLKIEDGRGRPLGRAFKVKLWPTLVFLRDGVERARVVRPRDAGEIGQALKQAGDNDASRQP